jgi:2',3'-cyclic-nucleotide 2'-phosphodiesterase
VTETLRALILGDIVGKPGCRAVFTCLPALSRELSADIVVANAENAADGFGLTPEIAQSLFAAGVTVITSGNHIWQKREILPALDFDGRILRPENYPLGVPGTGHWTGTVKDVPVFVLNLEGRVNLSPIRCPFLTGRSVVRQMRAKAKVSIVDFHADCPQEKEALAAYLDGEISAFVGTHTHVPTADERVLPKGTAYITDLGMTGPVDSVIGMKKEIAVRRSINQMPLRNEVAENPAEIMGVLVEMDVRTGKALRIERVRRRSAL